MTIRKVYRNRDFPDRRMVLITYDDGSATIIVDEEGRSSEFPMEPEHVRDIATRLWEENKLKGE